MKKRALILSLAAILLTGCDNKSTLSSNIQSSSSNSTNETSTSKIESDSNSISSSTNQDLNRIDSEFCYETFSSYNKQTYGLDKSVLSSTGSPKVLAVPVIFKDSLNVDLSSSLQSEIKSNIQKCLFGSSEDTSWESVSSYYKKSSYNKLNIQGEVADCFVTSKTLTQYMTSANNADDSTVSSDDIYEEVYNEYFVTNKYNVSDFDYDNDGVIDSIYLIYYYPQNTISQRSSSWPDDVKTYSQLGCPSDSTSLLWAYVYYHDIYKTLSGYSALSTYCWASYFFMTTTTNYEIDAHTYIHETGHLLGLNDYYGHTLTQNSCSPSGNNIMMDYNVGDHDPVTKMDLGWTSPYVFDSKDALEKDSYQITLSSFAETGDSVIIPVNNNGSSLNEFLIIDFYTPTNLNEKDALAPYPENSIQCINQSGIRIFHVNQNIMKIYWTSNYKYTAEYVDTLDFSTYSEDSYYTMAADNNMYYAYETNTPQIAFVSSQGNTTTNSFLTKNKTATSKDLYQQGDVFSTTNPNYTYYGKDGKNTKIPFDITIDSITSDYANITLTSVK